MTLDQARIIQAFPPQAGSVIDPARVRTVSGGGPVLSQRLWPIKFSKFRRAVRNEFRKASRVHVATCRCPRDIGEDQAKAFFAAVIMAYLQFYRMDRDGQCGLRVNFLCDGEQPVGERDGSGGGQDEAYLITFIIRPGGYLSLVVLHYRRAAGHVGYRHGLILSVVSCIPTVAEGVAAANATPEAAR
jgi:hypothetical protein